jgi:hypothetical protein
MRRKTETSYDVTEMNCRATKFVIPCLATDNLPNALQKLWQYTNFRKADFQRKNRKCYIVDRLSKTLHFSVYRVSAERRNIILLTDRLLILFPVYKGIVSRNFGTLFFISLDRF